MKLVKKYYSQFQRLNLIRKISFVLLIIIIICGPIVSILCTIAILNFSQLLYSINIPSGFIYLDLDIYSPETMTIQVPYEIKNPGIYDLTNIKISVDLRLNYINESNDVNITSLVFSRIELIGNCVALNTLTGIINGSFLDFFISPLIDFYDYSDEFETVYYLLDIDFKAKYFFGTIIFQFSQNNLNLFEF